MALGIWGDEFRELPRGVFVLAAARCINTCSTTVTINRGLPSVRW